MATNGDDYEDLLAQMEKEFEEVEKKTKKGDKKGKKKAGGTEEEPEDDGKEAVAEPEKAESDKKKKKETKKPATATQPKPETAEKPAEDAEKPEVEKPEKAAKGKAKKGAKEAEKPKEEAAKPAEEPEESKKESGKKGKDDKKPKKGSAALKLIKQALEVENKIEEEHQKKEDERIKKEEEARRLREEEERKEREKRDKKKQKEKQRVERLKQEGKFVSQAQKEKQQRALIQLGLEKAKIQEAAAVPVAKEKPKFTRKKKDNKQEERPETPVTETQEEKLQEVVQEAAEEAKGEKIKIKDEWDQESEESETELETKTKKLQISGVTKTAESRGADESEEESEEEESSEEESSEEEENLVNLTPKEKAKLQILKRHEEAEKLRTVDDLRCPVICVLGHVDTGKTKLLDNLRRTNVQEGEAGGITQQIGATNVPLETLVERTRMCKDIIKNSIRVPGLLIIDTPGHESFKSLRTRGSSLCDLAILVIDIMHGLEPQTIESINILKDKKTPFVVALNKIDRLFEWKSFPNLDIVEALNKQQPNTKKEFETRSSEVILQLAEQGLNAALYYKNPDMRSYISLIPTSAHSSDGTGNLIALILEFCQSYLAKRISYSQELQCSVLEVKVIPSLGTTIDVCLVNGKLKVCDTIIVPGQEGPIVTQIRGLIMPQPNRELRVKNAYIPHKEVKGAQGVKIAAKGLEKAMPGLPLYVASKDNEVEYYQDELQGMLRQALQSIKLSDTGVFVQASTLGSLEALLEFLKTSKIPYAGINIGPVHKKDVTRASIMLEKDSQWAVILAFDVKVEREAQEMADREGVKIFTADIIYHLFDKFMGYRDELKKKKREEFKDIAVFPCKLKIMPQFIFNTRDPIVVGVKVESGFLKVGTPLIAYCENLTEENKDREKFVDIGRVTGIEFNNKPLEMAKTGNEVCIKIDNTTGGAPKLLGRHFTQDDLIISKISRESIDAVKDYFREEMSKSDWQLIIELKKLFAII